MGKEESEEKYFSIEWKVENMSYFSGKYNAMIISPSFVVDEMEGIAWNIAIYPRGEEDRNRDDISVFLHRQRNENSVGTIKVKYEIAFIGTDGSVLKINTYLRSFENGESYGVPSFAKRKEVYDTERSIFLPEDTLTVRCRLWKNGESMLRDVRYFARTRIGVEKRTFLWNLENFSTLAYDKKCSYLMKSPMNDSPMMSIDLFVTAGVNCDEIIRFELSPKDKTIKYSTFKLSLADASENKVECNQDEIWFDEKRKCEKFTFFFTRKKLLANKTMFLPNDVLSLHWEWTFSKGIVLEEIEEVQYGCTSAEVKISDVQKVDDNKDILTSNPLIDNVKNLYEEKFLCDVKLKTSSGIFPAHKVILAASSSVFKSMFSSDGKENDGESVDVDELDDETVKRILHYMYTSSLYDLTWEIATGLYNAANKYAIPSLKIACRLHLKKLLSTSNACPTLKDFDEKPDGDLKVDFKDVIFDYLVKHGGEMEKSQWRPLTARNGKLAAELMYRLFLEKLKVSYRRTADQLLRK